MLARTQRNHVYRNKGRYKDNVNVSLWSIYHYRDNIIKKKQTEILELKTTTTEMKNSIEGCKQHI